MPRLISLIAEAGRAAGIEVGACGELAARPAGALLLMGLGVESLSVAWPALPEIRNLIRGSRMEDVRAASARVLAAHTSAEARRILQQSVARTAESGQRAE